MCIKPRLHYADFRATACNNYHATQLQVAVIELFMLDFYCCFQMTATIMSVAERCSG